MADPVVCWSNHASQPYVTLACDKFEETPKWGDGASHTDTPGVFRLEGDRLYSFDEEHVTCPACLALIDWRGEVAKLKASVERLLDVSRMQLEVTCRIYSFALLAVVSRPWNAWSGEVRQCPDCEYLSDGGLPGTIFAKHRDSCIWLTAARALGVA